MNVLIHYSQIDLNEWDSLVQNSPVTSWFQSREAFLFFDSLSFMEPFVVAVTDDNHLVGIVVGYLQGEGCRLKQALTRRAIIVGGPLLSEKITDSQLEAMLNKLVEVLNHRSVYIETRNLNDYSKWRVTFEKCGFIYQSHLNFHQDTSTIELINNQLSRTRKRHIRVGLRDGATIGYAYNSEDIIEFYQILSNLYRNKVKKPLPSIEFFQKLNLLPSGRILTVKYQNKIIGGMAYVQLHERVGYEWYVCGMDDAYKNLYPSELATYAGLEYAVKNNCSKFDFMGAGKPDISYGVRDFKAQFGGTLVEHGRFIKINNPLIYKLGSFVLSLLSKTSK